MTVHEAIEFLLKVEDKSISLFYYDQFGDAEKIEDIYIEDTNLGGIIEKGIFIE